MLFWCCVPILPLHELGPRWPRLPIYSRALFVSVLIVACPCKLQCAGLGFLCYCWCSNPNPCRCKHIYNTPITGFEALVIPVIRYCKNIRYPGKRDTGTYRDTGIAIPNSTIHQSHSYNISIKISCWPLMAMPADSYRPVWLWLEDFLKTVCDRTNFTGIDCDLNDFINCVQSLNPKA